MGLAAAVLPTISWAKPRDHKYAGHKIFKMGGNSVSYFKTAIDQIAEEAASLKSLRRQELYDPVIDNFVAKWKGTMGSLGEFMIHHGTQLPTLRLNWYVPGAYSSQTVDDLLTDLKPYRAKVDGKELYHYDPRDLFRDNPNSVVFYPSKSPESAIPSVRRLVLHPSELILEIEANITDKEMKHLDGRLRALNGVSLNGAFGEKLDVDYKVINIDIDVD